MAKGDHQQSETYLRRIFPEGRFFKLHDNHGKCEWKESRNYKDRLFLFSGPEKFLNPELKQNHPTIQEIETKFGKNNFNSNFDEGVVCNYTAIAHNEILDLILMMMARGTIPSLLLKNKAIPQEISGEKLFDTYFKLLKSDYFKKFYLPKYYDEHIDAVLQKNNCIFKPNLYISLRTFNPSNMFLSDCPLYFLGSDLDNIELISYHIANDKIISICNSENTKYVNIIKNNLIDIRNHLLNNLNLGPNKKFLLMNINSSAEYREAILNLFKNKFKLDE